MRTRCTALLLLLCTLQPWCGMCNAPAAALPPAQALTDAAPPAPAPHRHHSSQWLHRKKRGIRMFGRFDGWALPTVTLPPVPVPTHGVPLQGYDFRGRLVQYRGLPPWRWTRVHGKDYLMYTYVNQRSLEMGLNCAVSLREHGMRHLLFLCEDEGTCEVASRLGLYHYYPKALIDTLQEVAVFCKPLINL